MSSFFDVSPNEISQADKTNLEWVRQFALDACRLYLSGIWSSMDIEDVVINKIRFQPQRKLIIMSVECRNEEKTKLSSTVKLIREQN